MRPRLQLQEGPRELSSGGISGMDVLFCAISIGWHGQNCAWFTLCEKLRLVVVHGWRFI